MTSPDQQWPRQYPLVPPPPAPLPTPLAGELDITHPDAPDLPQLLDDLGRAWREAGLPLADRLLPPADEGQVRAQLAGAGLDDPPQEVVTWFTWFNLEPGGGPAWGMPATQLWPLQRAIQAYEQPVLLDDRGRGIPRNGWLPFSHTMHASTGVL